MIGWLILLVYVAGYVTSLGFAIRVVRDYQANPPSYGVMNWEYPELSDIIIVGLAVVGLPLLWPVLSLGILGWRLTIRKEAH